MRAKNVALCPTLAATESTTRYRGWKKGIDPEPAGIAAKKAMFKRALAEGLRDRNDQAAANKHLAFIACAYSRPAECESAFRAAFAADPSFMLTDAEVGHPLWGPVYKRVAAEWTKASKKS